MTYKRIGKNLVNHARKKFRRVQMMTLANAATMALTVRSFDRGLDDKDRPYDSYAPYSKQYKYRKEASGRNASRVNLSWSGRLRQGIRPTKVTDRMAIIDMTGASKVYGTFVNKKRTFMKLSPSVRKVVRQTFAAIYGGQGRLKGFKK